MTDWLTRWQVQQEGFKAIKACEDAGDNDSNQVKLCRMALAYLDLKERMEAANALRDQMADAFQDWGRKP